MFVKHFEVNLTGFERCFMNESFINLFIFYLKKIELQVMAQR